ncbi:MAG: VTT domain-containing protein [Chthoniobacterales bacterium]
MNDAFAFLVRHGPLVLFIGVFVEQIGLPIPAAPLLLAAGALVAAGEINWAVAVGSAAVGSFLADLIWFQLGRLRGARILGFLCRISFEPDSCIRSTQDIFWRHGMGAVVVSKFIPGLSTVMPPLAAIFRVPLRRFLFFDGLGCLLYPICVGGLGFLFSDQVVDMMNALGRIGKSGLTVVLGGLGAYIGFKYLQRRRLLRRLRVARITVDDLRRKQENGEPLMVVDLRSELDLKNDPFVIAGALRLPLHDLERRHSEIPRDRDIVLYCSCPNEVTSARTAWLLQKRGIERVRPLAGGIEAWRERQYPVEPYVASPLNGASDRRLRPAIQNVSRRKSQAGSARHSV